MKVYLELPVKSRGLQRVYDALVKYAPKEIEVTKDKKEADLVVLHVYGRHDQLEAEIKALKAQNKAYAMIQYCIRSTIKPNTKDWAEMWKEAELVWSYYDLRQLCFEDELIDILDEEDSRYYFPVNFYYAPLGVETDVFYNRNHTSLRHWKILASSQHALSEGARECAFAVKELGEEMLFLGHELRRGPDIQCISGIDDEKLAMLYSSCEFVSGLRRVEGFEQVALEGLMCGALPVFFDKPHYRKWFDGLAVFINEGPREEVIESLIHVFQRYPGYVPDEKIALAKERFNWQTIITGFWERVLI